MLRRWKIGNKIFLALIIVGIIPLSIMGIYSIYSASNLVKAAPSGLENQLTYAKEISSWVKTHKRIFVGLVVGSILLVIFFSVYITRMIIHPLKELNRGVRGISSGRLDLQLPILSHDEVGLLTDEFNRMALSLGSIRQKMIEQNRRLNTLYEAARVISSTPSIHELLKELVSHARILVNARYGAIGLRDEDGRLKKFISSGLSAKEVEAIGALPVGKGVLGLMLREKKPIRINDLSQDPRAYGFPLHHPVMKTFLGVPIILGDRVLGSYYFAEKIDGEPFTKADEEILHSLATDAAYAIERAELFDKIARHERELEKIVEQRTKELKEVHEELLRKERLAIMGQMSGGVAHEIKNPLAGIKGGIHYLRLKWKDGGDKIKEYLDLMEHEISAANKIVDDLLTFSRVMPAQRQKTEIQGIISEVLDLIKPPEDIEVKVDLNSTLPQVYVDKLQIRQVFLNIVTNAFHAMTDGGSLTVYATCNDRGLKNRYLDVSFTDIGCGIPEENLEKIFQPLFTTRRGGIGLGLAVSKTLVEVNGGKIGVESKEGKGTTFIVSLPIV